MSECIFCKIVQGGIPAQKVFENEDFLAFKDIQPAAPIHILIIPKKHVASLADVSMDDRDWLGEMMVLVPEVAKQAGLTDGFRTIINTGRVGGQEVPHLHIHVLGGPERLGRLVG